jgi:hypothetical protein
MKTHARKEPHGSKPVAPTAAVNHRDAIGTLLQSTPSAVPNGMAHE